LPNLCTTDRNRHISQISKFRRGYGRKGRGRKVKREDERGRGGEDGRKKEVTGKPGISGGNETEG